MVDIDNIILLILLLIVLGYLGQKYANQVKETFCGEKGGFCGTDEMYPVSHEVDQPIDTVDASIGHHRVRVMKNILEMTRDFGNRDIQEPKLFNTMYLPVTRSKMSVDEVKPIVDYLVDTINKLGKGIHVVTLLDVQDIFKDETERQSLVSFRMVFDYKVDMNDTHYQSVREGTAGEEENDLIIDVEIISDRAVMDDIFANDDTRMEKVYISRLHIVGLTHGDYLPGSNVSESNYFYPYTVSLSNKIIDEVTTKQKDLLQEEVNNITKELETADPAIDFNTVRISSTNQDDKFENIRKIHIKNPTISSGYLGYLTRPI